MRETCGSCGLRLERGEPDYFIGSMMWNLILSEFVLAVVLVGSLLATWPNVNWAVLQVALPLGMLASPLLLFPVSKLVWLAFDLALRPEPPPLAQPVHLP